MKLSQIAGTLGLDQVEQVRPVPLTDDLVGPVPPRPRNFDERGASDRAQRRVQSRKRRAGV